MSKIETRSENSRLQKVIERESVHWAQEEYIRPDDSWIVTISSVLISFNIVDRHIGRSHMLIFELLPRANRRRSAITHF